MLGNRLLASEGDCLLEAELLYHGVSYFFERV